MRLYPLNKYIILLLAMSLMGCGQTFNSNTEDFNLLPSSFCANQSNANLCAANEIIQTKCTNCHTSNIHAFWAAFDTDAEWVASGRVVAGDPDASTLVTKLKNYVPAGNMPDQAPPLTASEYQAILDWVNGIP